MGVTVSSLATATAVAELAVAGYELFSQVCRFMSCSPNANNPTVDAILKENERASYIREQLEEEAQKAHLARERLRELERKSRENAEQRAKEAEERAKNAEAEVKRQLHLRAERLENETAELKKKAQEDKEATLAREKEIREAATLRALREAEKKSQAEEAEQKVQAEELRKLKAAKEKPDKSMIAKTAAIWKDATVESKNKRTPEKVEDLEAEGSNEALKEKDTPHSQAKPETSQSEIEMRNPKQPVETLGNPDSDTKVKPDGEAVEEEKSAPQKYDEEVIDADSDTIKTEEDEVLKEKIEAQKAIEEAEARVKVLKAQAVAGKELLPPGFRIPTTEEVNAAKKRMQYDNELCHFAVCGPSGSGKSSLINALRGLPKGHKSAAETGENETTIKAARYPDPRKQSPYNRFVWYDIPGAGTPRIPTSWEYFHKFGLYCFDFIIIVYGVRFTNIDAEIIKHCKLLGIPFFIVRSKSDEKIKSMLSQPPYGLYGQGFEDDEFDFRNDKYRKDHEEAKAAYTKATRRDARGHLSELAQEYSGDVFERLCKEIGADAAIQQSTKEQGRKYINQDERVYIISSLNLERIVANEDYEQLVKEQTAAIQKRLAESVADQLSISNQIISMGEATENSTQFAHQLKSADDPPIGQPEVISLEPKKGTKEACAILVDLVQPISDSPEDASVQNIILDNTLNADSIMNQSTTESEKDTATVTSARRQGQEEEMETWEEVESHIEDSLVLAMNEQYFETPLNTGIDKPSPAISSANPAVTFDVIVEAHKEVIKQAQPAHYSSEFIAAEVSAALTKLNIRKPKPVQREKHIDEEEFISELLITALRRRYNLESKPEVVLGHGYSGSLPLPSYGTAKKARKLVASAGSAVKSKVKARIYGSAKEHSDSVEMESLGGHGMAISKKLLRRATGDKNQVL